jgi:hypothetical protein
MTSFSLPLPLDNGFIRRECPKCERQFKWYAGSTDDKPSDAVDPEVYCCPYCGETASRDHWWTRDQIEYAKAAVSGPVNRLLADELRRSLDTERHSLIRFDVRCDEPDSPAALHEPSDMVAVQSPCHPWEPLKIAEDWRAAVYCLICGTRFAT